MVAYLERRIRAPHAEVFPNQTAAGIIRLSAGRITREREQLTSNPARDPKPMRNDMPLFQRDESRRIAIGLVTAGSGVIKMRTSLEFFGLRLASFNVAGGEQMLADVRAAEA